MMAAESQGGRFPRLLHAIEAANGTVEELGS